MSAWFEEIDCSSAQELVEALMPHNRALWGEQPRDWIFRGQEEASWPLEPSAYRDRSMAFWDRGSVRSTLADQVRAEAAILESMLAMVDAQGLQVPLDGPDLRRQFDVWKTGAPVSLERWIPEGLWSLAALTQHYGLPTRLLDWSRRPLVGAYFAVSELPWTRKEGPKCPELAVWALRRRCGDQDLLKPAELTLVHAPRALIPNLHLQSGVFTAHLPLIAEPGSSPDRRDHQALLASAWAAGTSTSEPVLRKLILPHSEGKALLELLARHFVHGATVFAGYAGAARAVRERSARL